VGEDGQGGDAEGGCRALSSWRDRARRLATAPGASIADSWRPSRRHRQGANMPGQANQACAAACHHCAAACLREDDVKTMTRCIALDMDCAAACEFAAAAVARGSELQG